MNAAKLKGSLLEYIVRRLLLNCGFTRVKPDGLMIYNRGGLTMINGKGSAHDADVLMNPPIQMPFSYPFRLNFECKSYSKKIGLTIIRNALGLRYDINEFEIVTRANLISRQNNVRSSSAIDNRARFNYQVGVAAVEEFTKPAFEFAANNKIPLISLRWFLPNGTCDLFHQITNDYLTRFNQADLASLHLFLKGDANNQGRNFIENIDSHFKTIYEAFINFENQILIGLLESGDMLFLISENGNPKEYLSDPYNSMDAQFHYYIRMLHFEELALNNERQELEHWILSLNQEQVQLRFYLPSRIIQIWKNQNYEKQAAIDLKQNLFSKVFIFFKRENNNDEYPFRILKIDKEWLDRINIEDNGFL